jgi:hypothetical protein
MPFKEPPAPRQATAEDAKRHRIPAGFSLKNWDPTEEPIMLLDSVFDANSLGKWIYDWSVHAYGPGSPTCEYAGQLWLLLIQLSGKIKSAEEAMPKIRSNEDRELVEEFIEGGERITNKLRELLKACEAPIFRSTATKEKKEGLLVNNAGVEFVETLFGADREIDRTNRFLASIRLWNLRFDSNCEDIIKKLSGNIGEMKNENDQGPAPDSSRRRNAATSNMADSGPGLFHPENDEALRTGGVPRNGSPPSPSGDLMELSPASSSSTPRSVAFQPVPRSYKGLYPNHQDHADHDDPDSALFQIPTYPDGRQDINRRAGTVADSGYHSNPSAAKHPMVNEATLITGAMPATTMGPIHGLPTAVHGEQQLGFSEALPGMGDRSLTSKEDEDNDQTAAQPPPQPANQDVDDAATEYSNVSSATSSEYQVYIQRLAADLFDRIDSLNAADDETRSSVLKVLPELLKAFALKIGYHAPTQMHRDVMAFVHRQRL